MTYSREHYLRNREHILAKSKKRWEEKKEEIKAKQAEYYQNNKEKCNKACLEWRKNNPEKWRDYNEKYAKKHREEINKRALAKYYRNKENMTQEQRDLIKKAIAEKKERKKKTQELIAWRNNYLINKK